MSTSAAIARREDSRCALFLALVACLGLGYTAMAAQMEWRTSSGLIGPGFFPVFLGIGIVVCAVVALARILYRLRVRTAADTASTTPAGGETGEPAGAVPDQPWVLTTAVLTALMVVFVVFLQPLGSVFGSALFLLAALQVLNPGRWVPNVVLSLALPVGLYLLLQTLLSAGLPPGPLPV